MKSDAKRQLQAVGILQWQAEFDAQKMQKVLEVGGELRWDEMFIYASKSGMKSGKG